MRIRLVSLFLGLSICAACTGSSAELGTEPPVIGESTTNADNDGLDDATNTTDAVEAVPTATSAPTVTPITEPTATPTAVVEPTPAEPTATPEPGVLTTLQPPEGSGFPTVEATIDNAIVTGRFADMGCEQGKLLRGVVNDTEIKNIVSVVPFRVWLCANTAAVNGELFCYIEETKAIVAALPQVTDQDRLNYVSRLAEEDVVFCDNPYHSGLRDGSEYVP